VITIFAIEKSKLAVEKSNVCAEKYRDSDKSNDLCADYQLLCSGKSCLKYACIKPEGVHRRQSWGLGGRDPQILEWG